MKEIDLEKFFLNPQDVKQIRYEAIRAFIVDQLPADEVAEKFNYTVSTIYSMIRDAKTGKINVFPKTEVVRGPKERRFKDIQNKIICYRNKNFSVKDICQKLSQEKYKISVSTIQRILSELGFPKLERRTNRIRKVTKRKEIISERTSPIDFKRLLPFKTDCPIVGVFFFLPYIIESGIIDIVKKCKMPESSSIKNINACLSMLLLKLIGQERLSQIKDYDHEDGLGIFAGLNYLPKATYMNTYSCLTSESMLLKFQEQIIKNFKNKYNFLYSSDYINLDFHSIPHFGEDKSMEKVWCGSKGKTMKGANTIIAQDANSDVIIYTKADILRKNEASEILNFVDYWKKIDGDLDETLVFDCRLTKYNVLGKLDKDDIKFITLRKRNQKLLEETYLIENSQWKKVHLKIKKRKFPKFWTYENEIKLKGIKRTLRQIIIKGHGRDKPTFIITNNKKLELKKIIEVYAKRWHVENKISELVSFFNLNALSSPLMIRIHFDMLWTMIADTIYNIFKQEIPRFNNNNAQTIFRKFIDMPGKIEYDGKTFKIKIRKRATTPILKSIVKLQKPISIPWLKKNKIEFIWTF